MPVAAWTRRPWSGSSSPSSRPRRLAAARARAVDRSRHRLGSRRRHQCAEPAGGGQRLRGLFRAHGSRQPRTPLRRRRPRRPGAARPSFWSMTKRRSYCSARRCWPPSATSRSASIEPAALAAFRADPDRFDLVLTDEIMPGMTGTELAIALHRDPAGAADHPDDRPRQARRSRIGCAPPASARSSRSRFPSRDIAESLARHLVPRRRGYAGNSPVSDVTKFPCS